MSPNDRSHCRSFLVDILNHELTQCENSGSSLLYNFIKNSCQGKCDCFKRNPSNPNALMMLYSYCLKRDAFLSPRKMAASRKKRHEDSCERNFTSPLSRVARSVLNTKKMLQDATKSFLV
ncbi:hypothetical protein HI914_02051 [Erysiphe necator]|nr:hypothetical protein HI914_02051 [Erysiphe necator]